MSYLETQGQCPICDAATTFVAETSWLRDDFLCRTCGSIPRERALMVAIARFLPDWPSRRIHEASPTGRGASAKLAKQAAGYSSSQFYPERAPGAVTGGSERNEDLERLTFDNEAFDLFVTQDVMEHVFEPDRAFAEIARVLRPGGMHVFTTPLVNRHQPSEQRARRAPDGSIEHLSLPEYHSNPVDPKGALVTFSWGYDIVHRIYRASGLVSTIVLIDDLSLGIRAEYLEVLVSARV